MRCSVELPWRCRAQRGMPGSSGFIDISRRHQNSHYEFSVHMSSHFRDKKHRPTPFHRRALYRISQDTDHLHQSFTEAQQLCPSPAIRCGLRSLGLTRNSQLVKHLIVSIQIRYCTTALHSNGNRVEQLSHDIRLNPNVEMSLSRLCQNMGKNSSGDMELAAIKSALRRFLHLAYSGEHSFCERPDTE